MAAYFLLLLSAIITAGGQLLMKRGSQVIGGIADQTLFKKFFTIMFEPYIIAALFLYFGGMFLWLKVLSRSDLSFAYPITIGLTLIITSVASAFFFKETLTLIKVAGIAFIIVGIALLFNLGFQRN